MLQDNQVQIKLGTNLSGVPQYGDLTQIITPKVAIKEDLVVAFTLGALANLFILNANTPSGNAYITGDSYEAINGGYILKNATLNTHTTDTVIVGSRIGNLGILYDKNNDEVIHLEKDTTTDKVIGRKIVHVIFSTDLTDGVALSDNHIQLNFVIWDDVNNQLKAVDIEAGDYKVIFNRAYNKGTLSIAQLNGTVKEDYNLGGFAEDELLDLNVPKPFYVTATANSDITIGSDKKVIVTIGATAGDTVVKDSGGNTLDMTIEQLDTVVFDEFNKSLFELANGTAYFETILKPQRATVKSSSDVEVDLRDTIATNIIYQGNVLILQGVK